MHQALYFTHLQEESEKKGDMESPPSRKPSLLSFASKESTGKKKGMKYLTTAAILFGNVTFGCAFNFYSPALDDLRKKYETTVADISTVFLILMLSCCAGAVSSGFIYRLVNRQVGVIVCLAAMALSLYATPLCSTKMQFFGIAGVLGFFSGAYDAAQVVWMVELWMDKSGPLIQAQHFCYALGCIFPPLIVAPFLSTGSGNDNKVTSSPTEIHNVEEAPTSLIYIPFTAGGVFSTCAAVYQIVLFVFCRYYPPTLAPNSRNNSLKQKSDEKADGTLEENVSRQRRDSDSESVYSKIRRQSTVYSHPPTSVTPIHSARTSDVNPPPFHKINDVILESNEGGHLDGRFYTKAPKKISLEERIRRISEKQRRITSFHPPPPYYSLQKDIDNDVFTYSITMKNNNIVEVNAEPRMRKRSTVYYQYIMEQKTKQADYGEPEEVNNNNSHIAPSPEHHQIYDTTLSPYTKNPSEALRRRSHVSIASSHSSQKAQSTTSKVEDPEGEEHRKSKLFSWTKVQLIALTGIFLGAYQGMELCTMMFIPTFGQYSSLNLAVDAASYPLIGLSTAFAIGRFLGIFIALRLEPVVILVGNLFLALVGNTIFFLWGGESLPLLWAACIILGFGCSSVYAAYSAFIERSLIFTDAIGSFMIVCGYVNAALWIVYVGGRIEDNPLSMTYTNFLSIALCSLSLLCAFLLTRNNNKRY